MTCIGMKQTVFSTTVSLFLLQ